MIISVIDTIKGRIEYSSTGRGTCVLLVHGGHTDCRESIFQKGLDSESFNFIMPSRPGYGKTPLTEFNSTPKATADLYAALLDELNISKAIVIGISAGGLTALEMAANYPHKVDKLILESALTKKWFSEKDKVYMEGKYMFSPKVEGVTWFFYRLFYRLFSDRMTKMMFKSLSKYRPIKVQNEEYAELKKVTMNMRSGGGFSNDLDQSIDQKILDKIECPTLILHSLNDNTVDPSHAQNARARIKNAKLVLFNNRWGHMLWIGKEYREVLSELNSFLAKPC